MQLVAIKRLQVLLVPFSWLYRFGMGLRNLLYDSGWLRRHHLPVPVVSVGNITAGGTGKTPIVIFLAKLYQSAGKKVAILTRGYGRVTKEPQLVVGYNPSVTPDQIGDEPFLILTELKEIGLAVDKKRERGAAKLLAQMPVDVFLLDDGLQYRRLARDFEIVVLDAAHPFDNGHLIPAGLLREAPAALKRASLIWLTRVDEAQNLNKTIQQIRRFSNQPIVQSIHAPIEFRSLTQKKRLDLKALAGVEAIAFCAIGRPESFQQELNKLGIRLKTFQIFSDHHRFTQRDVDNLKILAEKQKVKYILCTEKDAVKLAGVDERFYFLKIVIQIVANRKILLDLLPGLP